MLRAQVARYKPKNSTVTVHCKTDVSSLIHEVWKVEEVVDRVMVRKRRWVVVVVLLSLPLLWWGRSGEVRRGTTTLVTAYYKVRGSWCMVHCTWCIAYDAHSA